MSKSQRDKGYRGEYNLVKILQGQGIECKRVPLSGGAPGTPGDLIINDPHRCEVKVRGNGFVQIYKWLEDNNFLFLKADKKSYLAVCELQTFMECYNNLG